MTKSRRKREDLGVLASLTAADVMVKEVKTVPLSMRVKDLIQYLALSQVSGVPVVDEAGKLTGVVSGTDIVNAQAHLEGKNHSCSSFYEYDPFGGKVAYFEECSLNMLDMQVKDLMTHEVFTVSPHEPLNSVIQLMLSHHIHRLIVSEAKVIAGLISTLDIMQALAEGKITLSPPGTRVADLIPGTTVRASEDMWIQELIDILADKCISGVPVVREDGIVLGVISQTDVIRIEAETDRRRYKYPDFYTLDPFMKKVQQVLDINREVLERRVKEFMDPRVISVPSDATITAAAKTMVAERVHRLLIVDPEGRLKGVISTQDVIKALG